MFIFGGFLFGLGPGGFRLGRGRTFVIPQALPRMRFRASHREPAGDGIRTRTALPVPTCGTPMRRTEQNDFPPAAGLIQQATASLSGRVPTLGEGGLLCGATYL
jgi:hypothetical protein